MNKTSLFIIATLSISLSNAMLTQYKFFRDHNAHNLHNIPSDIIKKIIDHVVNKPSDSDFGVFHQFRYISQASENLSEDIKRKCLDVKMYLQEVGFVISVNKCQYNRLSKYRNDLFNTSKTDKDFFLSTDMLYTTTKCFYTNFGNCKTHYDLKVAPSKCKVVLMTVMHTKTPRWINNIWPIITCKISILIPKKQPYFSFSTKQIQYADINYTDPLLKHMLAIQKTTKPNNDIDLKEFFHIESFFAYLTQCVFNNEELKAKKIASIFNLCKYVFTHFDNPMYPDYQGQRVSIASFNNNNDPTSKKHQIGISIRFNFGPNHKQLIPLELINAILQIG